MEKIEEIIFSRISQEILTFEWKIPFSIQFKSLFETFPSFHTHKKIKQKTSSDQKNMKRWRINNLTE